MLLCLIVTAGLVFPVMAEETQQIEPPATEPTIAETISLQTEPGETLPEETAAEAAAPEETISEPFSPSETVPEETAPTETVPVETVPEATVPTETVPVETAPAETVPMETVPAETAPLETVPEETVPSPDYEAMTPEELLAALDTLPKEEADAVYETLSPAQKEALERYLEEKFGLWMGFSAEELATFTRGYAGGITGSTLLGSLLELDEQAFRLAVNQMTAAQAGSLEGLTSPEQAARIAGAMIHRGFPAGQTSFSAAASFARMALYRAGEPVWPEEGSIKLSKDAAAIESTDNLWEVTLGIQGKNYRTTSDVVLVIDNSGSMSGTKLENTKKAAKAFADRLLTEDSGTRIAIVTYVASASTNGVFYTYETREAFDAAIDAMRANGGTNQQAGIHAADQLLYSAGSTGYLKNIVLLTDGEATYSYPFTGTAQWTGCSESWYRHSWNQSAGGGVDYSTVTLNEGCDYSTIVGSGSSFTTNNLSLTVTCEHGYTNTVRIPYNGSGFTEGNNGVATIWEAEQTKNRGTTVFSVALQAGTNGENVLKACASDPSRGYYAIGAGDDVESKLTGAFTAIAGRIAIAASRGRVEDTMGNEVQPVFAGAEPVVTGNLDTYLSGDADVYVSQGSAVYDGETRQILWTVGSVSEGDAPTMRYRVTIRDGCSPATGETLPTNECAYFHYRNYAGADTTGEFPKPLITVGGGTILMHWYRVNMNGEPVNEAGMIVESPALAQQIAPAAYYTVDGQSGLNYLTAYTVAKRDFPDSDYVYFGQFSVNAGALQTGDAAVVTLSAAHSNQHVWFAYCQEELCSLTVTKQGCQSADENQSFLFRIIGTEERTQMVDVTVAVHGNGSVTLMELPKGSYRITEVQSWSWRYTPEGSKDISAVESENAVNFRNTRTNDTWLNGGAWCDNSFLRK